jgi:hypothetical protein
VLWQLGRADDAVAQLKKAIEADATYAPAHDRLAEILAGSRPESTTVNAVQPGRS